MKIKRTSALSVGVLALLTAGLASCEYHDDDFVTRCAGHLYFRGFDETATHEVVVKIPSGWLDEAVASPVDVVKPISFPSSEVEGTFLAGPDLDAINLDYCTDFGSPPQIDETLTATAGQAEIVLHPATYWRNVTADLTLTEVKLEDADSSHTVVSFDMDNATVGKHA